MSESLLELITVGLDEGERIYVEDVKGHTAWINSMPVQLNELVTFTDHSKQDFPIVRKALKHDIACGYILSKDLIRSSDNLIISKMLLLGHILRLPCKTTTDIHPMEKLYINSQGFVDTDESGRDLKLLSTQFKAADDSNNFIVCFRQIGDNYIHGESKFCLDLMNAYFTQNHNTGEIFLHYEEGSILEQCSYIEDKEGVTHMLIPDIAILDTIVYNETDLATGDEHWAHKIDMNFRDCTRGD